LLLLLKLVFILPQTSNEGLIFFTSPTFITWNGYICTKLVFFDIIIDNAHKFFESKKYEKKENG